MRSLMNILCRVVLSSLPLIASACGGGSDATSSTATGQVKGKVTLRGKPVSKVDVSFNPSNVNRTTAPIATATLQADGTYAVTTLVGQNQVSLTGPGVAKAAQLSYYTKTIDVQTGENTLDIDIR